MSQLVAITGASGGIGQVTALAFARRGDRVARLTGAAGVLWGGVLLFRGADVWRSVADRPPGDVDQLALRLLGRRHLAQGGSQVIAPDRFPRLFVGVDVLHALSMFVLAAVDEPRRRPALVTGSAAAATAVLAVLSRRRSA